MININLKKNTAIYLLTKLTDIKIDLISKYGYEENNKKSEKHLKELHYIAEILKELNKKIPE